eukprot:jgi/Picsp_1/4478/NSC_06699-R1_hypothetical protein COCSUDRAFT_49280 [Coccomyxa subellipsoidea C-169]
MWSNLQQARARLGDTVKAITAEALETARELRDVHQINPQSQLAGDIAVDSGGAARDGQEGGAREQGVVSDSRQFQDDSKKGDVSSRLAAIRAKLEKNKATLSGQVENGAGGAKMMEPGVIGRNVSCSGESAEECGAQTVGGGVWIGTGADDLRHKDGVSVHGHDEGAGPKEVANNGHNGQRNKVEAWKQEITRAHDEIESLKARHQSAIEEMGKHAEKECKEAKMESEQAAGRATEAERMLEQVKMELEMAREQARLEKERMMKVEQRQQEHIATSSGLHEEIAGLQSLIGDLRRENKKLAEKSQDGDVDRKHALEVQLMEAREALSKSESEQTFLREQLKKLKTQMLGDQEEEEEKIRWRVDAEVKLELERLGLGADGIKLSREDEKQLMCDLEIAVQRADEADRVASKWESIVAARDAELGNMQRALGELSYESDAAEQLRAEVRTCQSKIHKLEDELVNSKRLKEEAEAQAKAASELAAEERRRALAARESEGAAKQEMVSLQVAYNDLANKTSLLDGKYMYKREFILDLLKKMAGLRHSQAMRKAAEVLELDEKEMQQVWGDKSASLANSWVSFLESQAKETQ